MGPRPSPSPADHSMGPHPRPSLVDHRIAWAPVPAAPPPPHSILPWSTAPHPKPALFPRPYILIYPLCIFWTPKRSWKVLVTHPLKIKFWTPNRYSGPKTYLDPEQIFWPQNISWTPKKWNAPRIDHGKFLPALAITHALATPSLTEAAGQRA